MTTPLIATCWTSAGDTSPIDDDPRSPESFQHRIEAAAGAGYVGMGFLLADLEAAEAAHGINGMRSIIRDNGLTHLEVELLTGWWNSGTEHESPESEETRRKMLHFTEKLGIGTFKVASDDSGEPWHLGPWAAQYHRLAAEAADVGARLALEFLPWMNIATVSDAMGLIRAADHPNAGMVIDVWHVEHMNTDHAEIEQLPASAIVSVELSDAGPRSGPWLEDTIRNRRYCGEGDFRLPSFVAALRKAGFSNPWGVEILSETHRRLPIEQGLARAAESAWKLLG